MDAMTVWEEYMTDYTGKDGHINRVEVKGWGEITTDTTDEQLDEIVDYLVAKTGGDKTAIERMVLDVHASVTDPAV